MAGASTSCVASTRSRPPMRTVVDEIARGYATDTLRAELHTAEQSKRALLAELEALTGRKQAAASLDVERLRRELLRHASEIRTLLGRDIPRTRQILRRLLVTRLSCPLAYPHQKW